MPARPRLRSAGISALAAVFLGACGVSIQSSPVDIPPDKIPFGLMRTTTSTTGPTQPRQALMEVFFVSSGKLTASNRVVSGPLQISDALSTLLDGPTNLEAFAGITTDIPSGTSIRSSKLSGSTAT
ncbi:MAG TPA: hypothetical protein VMU77_01745, partial [Acidimicrobiales bacterium]|nr:hypothetical protein [Acidimicrobiales bacterium]